MVFTKPITSTAGLNTAGGSVEDVIGVQLVSTSSTLGSNLTTASNLANWDSYNGLPLTALHFQLSVTDTAGGTTAPATLQSLENVIKTFKLQSLNGNYSEPVLNMDGTYFNFSRTQRLKNPYGYYVSAGTGTATTSGTTTNDYNFDLYFTIRPELFPLKPTVTFNTVSSRATTLNGLTSGATLTVTGDYTKSLPNGQPSMSARRTRMKFLAASQSSTGTPALQSNWDKSVTIVQQALDFGADGNLSNSNTFNFSLGGQQIFNNKPYQDIINAENAKFPGTSHISGFFPFGVADLNTNRYINNTLSFSANISSAPYVNSSSGPNSYTDTFGIYLEEVF